MGGNFSEEKKGACGNVVSLSGLPKIWGPFFWKKKGACGNVPTSSGLPEIWGPFFWKKKGACGNVVSRSGLPKNPKNENSQNQNPFCPKCRRGFFKPEKGVPAPFGALPGHFLRGPEKSKKCNMFAYFPWWANGPYSFGLGSCAGVMAKTALKLLHD